MAEPLEAELALSTESALDSVHQLGSTLDDALSGAAEDFGNAMGDVVSGVPPLELVADTDAIEPAVSDALDAVDTALPLDPDTASITTDIEDAVGLANVEVPIAADTVDAESQVDDFRTATEADPLILPVETDTTAAEQDLGDLANTTDEAAQSQQGLAQATHDTAGAQDVLASSSALATGRVYELSAIASHIHGTFGKVVATGLAVGSSIGYIAKQGLDALGTMQRFDAIVGTLGDRIEHVQVGTLRANLDDLAISLGTDDEALRDSVTNLVSYSKSAGFSSDQTVDFTHNVVGLASRAVALKPSIGGVNQATDKLSLALARGGPKLQQYNIVLNAQDIIHRALQNTQKATSAELTVLEKAYAGSQLAIEKYGASLKGDIQIGTENVTIRQKALKEEINNVIEAAGKPLAEGLLGSMKEAIPALEAFARPLGELGATAIPVLVVGLQILAPVLEAVSTSLASIPTPILAAVAGAFLLGPAINLLGKAGEFATLWVGNLGKTLTLTAAEEAVVTEQTALASSGFVVMGEEASVAGEQAAVAGAETAGSMSLMGAAVPGVLAFTAAFVGTTQVLKAIGAEDFFRGVFGTHDWDKEAKDVEDALTGVANAAGDELLPAFRKLEGETDDFETSMTSKQRALTALNKVFDQSPEKAYAIVNALHATGANTTEYTQFLDHLVKKQADSNQAQQAAALQYQATADAIKSPLEIGLEYVDALKEQDKIIDELANQQLGYEGALINVADSQQAATDAQNELNDAITTYGVGTVQAQAAQRKLDEANIAYTRNVLDLDAEQKKLNDSLGTLGPEGIQKEIDRLTDLQNRMPQYAGAIQPLIDKLNDAAQQRRIDIETQQALDNFGAFVVEFNRQMALINTDPFAHAVAALGSLGQLALLQDPGFQAFLDALPQTATGGIFRTPQVRTVAESGAEVVIPLDDPARARQLLKESGLSSLSAATNLGAPIPITWRPVGPLPSVPDSDSQTVKELKRAMHELRREAEQQGHPRHVDNSITIEHLDASGKPDPTRTGIAVARHMRYAQFERSNQ